MTEETKTHFTFSFFDAAHTDGYVPPTNDSKRLADNQLISHQQGKGFFSEEEENEDIVTKIHRWKQSTTTNESKTKTPLKRQELHNLFADSAKKKENAQPESDDNIPVARDDIQLNRLLDDCMLGEKGDRIMQLMEDLTTSDSPPSEQGLSPLKKTEQEEPPVNFDAMLSMEDFEKYIAEN